MRPSHALRACLCGWLALGVLAAAAAAGPERAVKAAFLLKFPSYVEFAGGGPAAGEPLVIGVVGAVDIGAELAQLAARGGAARPVVVRTLRAGDALAGVHVLFVGDAEADHAARLLRAAARQGALSVSESDGALREGSVLNFRLVDGRVRFEVSLEAAERANIKLSSRLLSVAYLVQKAD
ncbi:MAG: YfiR family protein [Massilia sp.]